MRVKVSLLITGVLLYLSSTALVGGVALWLTLHAYAASGETLSATTSAAILNTAAATLLWLAFFGGFDMFLTLWTIMQNRQHEAYLLRREETEQKEREAREKAMKEERRAREEERAAREKALEVERAARSRELDEQRKFQQALIEHLAVEREETRRLREEERRAREEERREREEERREREENRQEREQFFATLLQAERERSDLLMTRLLDLTDRLDKRNNGNGNGNGTHNAE